MLPGLVQLNQRELNQKECSSVSHCGKKETNNIIYAKPPSHLINSETHGMAVVLPSKKRKYPGWFLLYDRGDIDPEMISVSMRTTCVQSVA
jgi:hypothetical protein